MRITFITNMRYHLYIKNTLEIVDQKVLKSSHRKRCKKCLFKSSYRNNRPKSIEKFSQKSNNGEKLGYKKECI